MQTPIHIRCKEELCKSVTFYSTQLPLQSQICGAISTEVGDVHKILQSTGHVCAVKQSMFLMRQDLVRR